VSDWPVTFSSFRPALTLQGASVWLRHWSEANQRYGGNPHVGRYIGIYFAFGVGSAALVVVQTLILWIFCSIEVRQAISRCDAGNTQCWQTGKLAN
jgi:hypothetical protein